MTSAPPPGDPRREAARQALALEDETLLRECDIDLFVASGPGGQHRNKTESGVRLVHRPTGVVVTATERRSQIMNRNAALERLRGRLKALTFVPKPRRPTKATRGAHERRLSAKKKSSTTKRLRQRPLSMD